MTSRTTPVGSSAPARDHTLSPSRWIRRFAHLVPSGARVLDIAAGQGRHARFFASRGARVLAVDRDATALASLADVAGIEARVVDPYMRLRAHRVCACDTLPHVSGTQSLL